MNTAPPAILLLAALMAAPTIAAPPGLEAWFAPDRIDAQRAFESSLAQTVSPDSLRDIHTMLSSYPHVAGTEGDERVTQEIVAYFQSLGLDVELHTFYPLLSYPQEASLEILTPDALELTITEAPLEEDPYSADDRLAFGWNAYAASGDVTGEIVYANYATKEDFERLAELGIDLGGKIVLARYGGNYRGYKVKFAQEAGAAGVIIFTDPGSNFDNPESLYPQGGHPNQWYIQRGSVLTLPYPGDPLTPFEPATRHAPRLDPAEVALPTIPSQPIGWGAAREILSRMEGVEVPDESWKGGLPETYRLTGGENLTVRLKVEQDRILTRAYNIVATLPGSEFPEQTLIIGAHYDAWSFGSGDPCSGTMLVLEAARAFAEAAQRGDRPKRTLKFACWGAEEFGIIGSTEYVELHHADLTDNALAYLNLDMATMGPRFGASASPSLKPLLFSAAAAVEIPAGLPATEGAATLYDDWFARTARNGPEPGVGFLGGGSDHVGFLCHLGIPSLGASMWGAPGASYHSNYETLTWYHRVVGDDYLPGTALGRFVTTFASRLTNADLLPFSAARYGLDLRAQLADLSARAVAAGFFPEPMTDEAPYFIPPLRRLAARADALHTRALSVERLLNEALASERLTDADLAAVNDILLHMERAWIRADGIPGRPWYRSLFAATDEDSGYAPWPLPGLRSAVEHADAALLDAEAAAVANVLDRLERRLNAIEEIAGR